MSLLALFPSIFSVYKNPTLYTTEIRMLLIEAFE